MDNEYSDRASYASSGLLSGAMNNVRPPAQPIRAQLGLHLDRLDKALSILTEAAHKIANPAPEVAQGMAEAGNQMIEPPLERLVEMIGYRLNRLEDLAARIDGKL